MHGIADYLFERELGRGNYGRFYLARRPERLPVADEHVAVKVMDSPAADNDAFRRAARELRAFAAVRSPYLVRLFDAGQDRGRIYYAMEYLPQGSLGAPAGDVPRRSRLRAVADASRAAHDLHEAGLVHRDIAPGNVLLHEDGGRLSDLGLAQILSPGVTLTGFGSLPSVQYLDPAVLRGGPVSRATEIWALGVTLHCTLTGAGVYPDLPVNDAMLAIRTVLNRELRLAPGLSAAERDVVLGCLDPDVRRRYPTAAELAGRLDALAAAADS